MQDATNDSDPFVITERNADHTYFRQDDLGVELFIEAVTITDHRAETEDLPHPLREGDTYYNAGAFDLTIGSPPVIPSTSETKLRSRDRAIGHLLNIAANLSEHVEDHRETEAYKRAQSLADAAEELREKYGEIPGYEVSRQQNKVYSGISTWEGAHDHLLEAAQSDS